MSEEVPQYQTRASINAPTSGVPFGAALAGSGADPEPEPVGYRSTPTAGKGEPPGDDAALRVRLGDRVRLPLRYGHRVTRIGPIEREGTVVAFEHGEPIVSVVHDASGRVRWRVPVDELQVIEPDHLRRLGGAPTAAPPRDHTPFERGRRYVPAYYRPRRANRRIAADADPSDIGDAFALRPLRSIAIKYLVRAGYKPGQSAAKDLTKALEVIQRELEYLEVGGEEALARSCRIEWDDVSGHEVEASR